MPTNRPAQIGGREHQFIPGAPLRTIRYKQAAPAAALTTENYNPIGRRRYTTIRSEKCGKIWSQTLTGTGFLHPWQHQFGGAKRKPANRAGQVREETL